MYRHNPDITREVDGIAKNACRLIFEAYGVELTLLEDQSALDHAATLFCGVLGFTGPAIRGSILLAGSRRPFEETCPVEGTIRDWVGELTNQLVGKLKAKLVERGVQVALGIPVVLQGEHIAPLPRPPSLAPTAFATRDGCVLVWVDIETGHGFKLKPGSESAPPADDGEAFFF